MRRIILLAKLAILALVCGTAQSCQEGGDIGVLYGEWVFDEMTVNGSAPANDDFLAYYMRYSGSVASLGRTLPFNGAELWMGSWTRQGDDLMIDYVFPNNTLSVVTSAIGFDSAHVVLNVQSETSRSLHLEYVDSAGNVYKYKLRKLI